MTGLDQLLDPEAQRILETAPLLRLAYSGTDGTPRVIPIGYVWKNDTVVICTATTAPKVRALQGRSDVAITIDEGVTPMDAKAVLIRGVATVDIVDGVPDDYLEGAAKVMPAEQVPVFAEAVRGIYDRMARITIAPTWARYFDFAGGVLPEFLSRLASRS